MYAKLVNKEVVPCTLAESARFQLENPKARYVAKDRVGPYSVSTVFLFVRHLGGWFETAVFRDGTVVEVERYETNNDAVFGHIIMVEKYEKKLIGGFENE